MEFMGLLVRQVENASLAKLFYVVLLLVIKKFPNKA